MAARILIIEDESALRTAYAFLLQREGYDVWTAEHGQAGLLLLKEVMPDLIILDMLMPVMNGMTFLKQARLPKRYPAAKVLLLSNVSDAITGDDAQQYGVTESILKAALSPSELALVVKKMVTSDNIGV